MKTVIDPNSVKGTVITKKQSRRPMYQGGSFDRYQMNNYRFRPPAHDNGFLRSPQQTLNRHGNGYLRSPQQPLNNQENMATDLASAIFKILNRN